MVACIADADLLIILSDIDGFFDSHPAGNPDAKFIPEVLKITMEMESNSTTRGSGISSGGMYTKLAAARITMANGIPMIIANSSELYTTFSRLVMVEERYFARSRNNAVIFFIYPEIRFSRYTVLYTRNFRDVGSNLRLRTSINFNSIHFSFFQFVSAYFYSLSHSYLRSLRRAA